jgi:2-phospho-L-lactate/phosphoenolpyruvate guanylyltransferase
MTDFAIVPVKSLSEAKRRLTNHLDPEERRALVLSMLDDVLVALINSRLFSEIHIISPDLSLGRTARKHRVGFIRQKGAGLNAAIRQALRHLALPNVSSVTTVLADLPLVKPSDFVELMRISRQSPRIVLAPSLKGGTNVMLRAPDNVIKTSYGRWSYAKHLRAGQGKSLPVYSISNPRLSFDVDTIEDVKALVGLDLSRRTHAARVAKKLSSKRN